MTSERVTIHEFEPDLDLKGAKVIDGFPSVGLVSTIAANFLIDTLKLRQIGVVDHPAFPTLSVVHNGEPLAPVRIYSGEVKATGGRGGHRLVVFVSEFQPAPLLVRPIGEAIIEWARKNRCDYIISPEGLVLEGPAAEDDIVEVYALASTPRMRKIIEDHNLESFREGIIAGVCGIMLNIGKRESFDVLSILAEAHANYPDARSAAHVIDVIGKLLDMKLDLDPLFRQAEGFEKQIKTLQKQARIKPTEGATPQMYG